METISDPDGAKKIRFMMARMFSHMKVLAAFLVISATLSIMYYNAILHSHITFPILASLHEISISILAGVVIALGLVSNIYVMKTIMGSGDDAMKAATRTALSVIAGACGCLGSFVSVFISLGIGAGIGILAYLEANMLIFLAVAIMLSLASLKLAGNTLSNAANVHLNY